MRIGVVGDTHNRMPNVERIVALFREARVDRVVHTTTITVSDQASRPRLCVSGWTSARRPEASIGRGDASWSCTIRRKRPIHCLRTSACCCTGTLTGIGSIARARR